ncbi:MAG: recombination mediator RecR [Candidatus Competibacterales bacterium]
MTPSPLLAQLMDALRCLPGVGPKSAQRLALHLLERDRPGAQRLVDTLSMALERIDRCRRCRLPTETELCALCADPQRQRGVVCVVESPADVLALENATDYRGLYFVLMGHLSPLDGIGPEELGLDLLESQLAEGVVEELIMATNPTVEGEATAHYIAELARERRVRITRIAHGVPLGGELEYTDRGTLSHAFNGRRDF